MKEKITKLFEEAKNIFGEDSDMMIVVHSKKKCGTIMHGAVEKCAHAMFAGMFNEDRTVANSLYGVIKLNVMNLLMNDTAYGTDLLDSIEREFENLISEMKENEADDEVQQLQ